MSYSPTPAGQQLINKSLTKLIIYFKDGNARTFHGRSTARYTPADPRELEISRLKKYTASVGDKISMAILYDRQTDEELGRFKNGSWL